MKIFNGGNLVSGEFVKFEDAWKRRTGEDELPTRYKKLAGKEYLKNPSKSEFADFFDDNHSQNLDKFEVTYWPEESRRKKIILDDPYIAGSIFGSGNLYVWDVRYVTHYFVPSFFGEKAGYIGMFLVKKRTQDVDVFVLDPGRHIGPSIGGVEDYLEHVSNSKRLKDIYGRNFKVDYCSVRTPWMTKI